MIDVFQSILAEMFDGWYDLGCLDEMVNEAKIAPANLESSTTRPSFLSVIFAIEGGLVFAFSEIFIRTSGRQKQGASGQIPGGRSLCYGGRR